MPPDDRPILAPIRSYRELIALLRARMEEAALRRLDCDEDADFAPGYTAKVMVMMKNLGPRSFGAYLTLANVDLLAVERCPQPKPAAKPKRRR